MEDYKRRLAGLLCETGALFFDKGLLLKDGRPTPYFVNLAMFRTGRLALAVGSFFADMMEARGIARETDIVLGPSYKGSALALATSIALWQDHNRDLLFEYDRKEAKTHGEATRTRNLFVNGSLFDGCRVFVVDDVGTSMATKVELLDKLASECRDRGIACRVMGIGICVDREQTTACYDRDGKVLLGRKGENAMEAFVSRTGIPVYSVAGIREIVTYVHAEGIPLKIHGVLRPIDDDTRRAFDAYLATYGT